MAAHNLTLNCSLDVVDLHQTTTVNEVNFTRQLIEIELCALICRIKQHILTSKREVIRISIRWKSTNVVDVKKDWLIDPNFEPWSWFESLFEKEHFLQKLKLSEKEVRNLYIKPGRY